MSDLGVKNAGTMKVLGWLLIGFSIVEFAIGGAVYSFLTNVHLGAWWGAICCFIAGICGAISNGRATVTTGLVFSIFAIIIAIVGAIVDGIASGIISAEKGCTNTETHDFYGTDEGKMDASYCAYGKAYIGNAHVQQGAAISAEGKTTEAFYNLYYNRPYNNYNNNFFYNHPSWQFYYNVNHFYNWYQTHNTYYWNSNHNNANNNFYYNHPYYNANNNFYYNHPYYNANNNNNNYYYNTNNYFSYGLSNQCICSDGSALCYGYDLSSGNDCGSILTTYSPLLSASTAFLVLLVLLSFIYSIYSCIACNDTSSGAYAAPPAAAPAPVVIQMAPNPGAMPGYVQPGQPQQMYAPQQQYAPQGGYAPQQGYAQPYAPVPVMTGYVPQSQPVVYATVVANEPEKAAI